MSKWNELGKLFVNDIVTLLKNQMTIELIKMCPE